VLPRGPAISGLGGGVWVVAPRRGGGHPPPRLRAGTKVPKVSATTKALAAKLPRSMPSRSTTTEPGWPEPPLDDEGVLVGPTLADALADGDRADLTAVEPRLTSVASDASPIGVVSASSHDTPGDAEANARGAAEGDTDPAASAEEAYRSELDEILADVTIGTGPSADARPPAPRPNLAAIESDGGGIELPTSLEPKSQRSPWAWAAGPDWTKEEEDMSEPSDAGRDR
jgi:hypothetical protein